MINIVELTGKLPRHWTKRLNKTPIARLLSHQQVVPVWGIDRIRHGIISTISSVIQISTGAHVLTHAKNQNTQVHTTTKTITNNKTNKS